MLARAAPLLSLALSIATAHADARDEQLWKQLAGDKLADPAALDPGRDDLWQSARKLASLGAEALERGEVARACRLTLAALRHDATRGHPELAAGAPRALRKRYALSEQYRRAAKEIAGLCAWAELDRRLRRTGRRAKEIAEEVDVALGLDGNPLNPNRARDIYKRDGSVLTPLEAAEYTWAHRAAVKRAAEAPPPPPDPVAEAAAADAAAQAAREEGFLQALREQKADDGYFATGGVYHAFLRTLDELVGGIDEMSERGVRESVRKLPRAQKEALALKHSAVFAREEGDWGLDSPRRKDEL
ncbi:hypothetical protein AB1Y20_020156 [Prymnesium parvum]|uniref:KIF-binding protein n=1 Tax=Prymnesium parvum TaxID=97485 RepID=A0AB34JYG1_PRYPA